MAPAGQAIYVYDLARKDAFAATFVPLRRRDAEYEVTFEPGVATYRSRARRSRTRADGLRRQIRARRIQAAAHPQQRRSRTAAADRAVMEIVLAETPNDSLGAIETATDDDLKSLYFRNPRNDFVKGWAFVSTSLDAEFAETSRRRFLGHESRDPALPYMVEHGHPDAGAPAHERKVAAFCGSIDVAAGGEALVVVAHGQTDSLEDAKLLASRVRDPAFALRRAGREPRRLGRRDLGAAHQDQPARLRSPGQRLAALSTAGLAPLGPHGSRAALGRDRLSRSVAGRDPADPSGAAARPGANSAARGASVHRGRRGQMVASGAEWRHRSWRPHPCLGPASRGCPMCALRYVNGTGDAAILDCVEPFLEAPPVPKDQEGEATVPLTSRDKDTLLGHCARAIDYTLDALRRPWTALDGLGRLGRRHGSCRRGRPRRERVDGLLPARNSARHRALVRSEGRRQRAPSAIATQATKLRAALAQCWRGDRYPARLRRRRRANSRR